MKLTQLAVGRPVGVTMAVFALLLFAGVALQGLGLDLLPNLEFPLATVVTVYPGADPGTVETEVTTPLENSLATVAGLKRLRSISMENVSLILADFEWGTDLEDTLRQVETNLTTALPNLPPQAERPLVLRTDLSQLPFMLVAVAGEGGPVAITEQIRTRVQSHLQQLPGVASVGILGGEHEEVSVRYDSGALDRHGLTPTLLYQILSLQNTVIPAGVLVDQGVRYQVKAGRRIQSIEDLRNQPLSLREPSESPGLLALAGGLPVRLREVADVTVQPGPREGATRIDGAPAVVLRIHKQSGENTVAVAARVREALERLETDDSLDLTFHTLTDQSELIRHSLKNLSTAGAVGSVLAVAVLLLFLRSLGSIAVIAVAIPLSLLAALIILHISHVTLNLMSLGGLALAVGMLVDNAIVVLENITRHRQLGKSPVDAALDGGSEIGPAITASTLTTLVVFLPILFVQSFAGHLFRDMGVSVSAALFASLCIALTVVPAAAARWLKRSGAAPSKIAPPRPESLPQTWQEAAATRDEAESTPSAIPTPNSSPPAFARIQSVYERALERWVRHRWPTFLGMGVLLTALWTLPAGLGSQFLPPMDGGIVNVHLSLPPGSTAAETIETAARLEDALLKLPEVERVATLVGEQGGQDLVSLTRVTSVNQAEMTVILRPHHVRRRSAADVADAVAALPRDAGVRLEIAADRTAAALGDDFFPGVTLQITGPDLGVLEGLAERTADTLRAVNGLRAVATSLSEAQPELYFHVTERSFQGVLAGGDPLTAGQVGLALRNHLTGATATHVLVDGRRLPLVLRPHRSETQSIDALQAFRVPGAEIRLGDSTADPVLGRIATVTRTAGPLSVHHLNRERLVTIQAELDGVNLEEAGTRTLSALKQLEIPEGYRIRLAGLHQVIAESRQDMAWVLLLALVLVYIVMAAQFESLVQPLIILIAVPLAAVGALISLKLFGHALSVPSLIGLVLLVGIAVNNGIVMIDYINLLLRRGDEVRRAVIAGASVRLRPIIMTAITSLFGLLPLAVGWGEGSEFQIPMAVAVIGGLITSTLLTLFMIPGLVLLVSDMRKGLGKSPAAICLALLCLFGLGLQPAEAKETVWSGKGLFTLHLREGLPPDYLGGGSISVVRGHSRFGAHIAAGVEADSTRVLGLSGEHYFPEPGVGGVNLSVHSDHWTAPQPAHESMATLAWRGTNSRSHLSISHASGERTLHPWSGRAPAEAGWRLNTRLETTVSPTMNWERSISLDADVTKPPRWLLLTGPSWLTDVYRTFFHGGLLLQEGRYAPLLRLGASVSLLPQGEVELSLAPSFSGSPPDWPVFGVGYRGMLGKAQATTRIEIGLGAAGFDQRAYIRLKPAERPIAFLVTWTKRTTWQGTLSLQRDF